MAEKRGIAPQCYLPSLRPLLRRSVSSNKPVWMCPAKSAEIRSLLCCIYRKKKLLGRASLLVAPGLTTGSTGSDAFQYIIPGS